MRQKVPNIYNSLNKKSFFGLSLHISVYTTYNHVLLCVPQYWTWTSHQNWYENWYESFIFGKQLRLKTTDTFLFTCKVSSCSRHACSVRRRRLQRFRSILWRFHSWLATRLHCNWCVHFGRICMTAGASQRNPREEGTYKSYRTVIKSTKL